MKIKTALLSFGMSGRVFHAPFLHLHEGFELLGAWERSRQVMHELYPGIRSYDSLEAVLADGEVELVVVNTPTYTHYDYAKKALLAGKHVVVEKAFVGTTEEAEELRDLGAKNGLKVIVFQNRRWDSDLKTVKSVLDEGVLGEIIEARIAFDRFRPELSPKSHKELPSAGAGILKDLGAHVIDQALYLFGMPESVFADIRSTRPGSEVDDYFDVLLKYDRLSVHVHGGYYFRQPLPEFSIYGTQGSFLKTRADVQEDQLQLGMKPDDVKYGVEPEVAEGVLHTVMYKRLVPTLKGNYMDFYEGVYQCIRKGAAEPVSAEEGVRVMRIIDAAFQSAAEGRVVVI